MKFGKYLLRIVVLVSVLLTLSVQADAHTLWVNFTDYMPSAGGSGQMKTKLYIGWGHHFPVDSFVKAEDFEKIVLRDPTGREKNVALETTGFAAAALTLEKPGIYTAAATRKESMNTAYEENGKKVTYKGPKTGKKNIISSVYSQQFAKSIICGGELITGDASHVFGQKLEIIPVTNPYEIMNNRGGIMKVKVLFEGKPVPFLKIWGVYQGYTIKDEASAFTSTNGEGIATFRINHWGVWLLRTRYDRPAAGELAEKVNEEHYFSSLTFCVP